MTALKIDFSSAVPRLDLAKTVSGFASTVQAAAVHLVTIRGTDAVYPSRGTDLFTSAVRGEMVDISAAQHVCNFAALDTLTFRRTQEQNFGDAALVDFRVTPVAVENGKLSVALYLLSAGGESVGAALTA